MPRTKNSMIWNRLEQYRDVGLLTARIGLGVGFIFYHGWGKLMGGPERWERIGSNMDMFGIEFGYLFWGIMLTLAETLGAVLIVVGFLFRPVCFVLAFGMFVAWMSHVASGEGNPGHSFKNFFVLVGLAFVGPGSYSVDAWLERKRSEGGDA